MNRVRRVVLFDISYCIFCGGKLPEPASVQRSVARNPDQEREALDAVESARSLAELENILGPPDDIEYYEPSDFDAALDRMMQKYSSIYEINPNDQWVRLARYAKR